MESGKQTLSFSIVNILGDQMNMNKGTKHRIENASIAEIQGGQAHCRLPDSPLSSPRTPGNIDVSSH